MYRLIVVRGRDEIEGFQKEGWVGSNVLGLRENNCGEVLTESFWMSFGFMLNRRDWKRTRCSILREGENNLR